jgi:hypothetical protein
MDINSQTGKSTPPVSWVQFGSFLFIFARGRASRATVSNAGLSKREAGVGSILVDTRVNKCVSIHFPLKSTKRGDS